MIELLNARFRRSVVRGMVVASILVGMTATTALADSDRVSFQPVADSTATDRGGDEPSVYEAPTPVYVPVPELPGFLRELTGEMDVLVASK